MQAMSMNCRLCDQTEHTSTNVFYLRFSAYYNNPSVLLCSSPSIATNTAFHIGRLATALIGRPPNTASNGRPPITPSGTPSVLWMAATDGYDRMASFPLQFIINIVAHMNENNALTFDAMKDIENASAYLVQMSNIGLCRNEKPKGQVMQCRLRNLVQQYRPKTNIRSLYRSKWIRATVNGLS